MQELRFVAVSEDGRYAVLAVPGRSARFMLPIDERLRAVALGQTSRLAQYEIEVESPLRPKEIQARIRAGETVEEIADAAGVAVERVRWFEAPVLAERAYIADQAQAASVRRQGDATPGPRLGEIVTDRLNAFGADPQDAQWDAKKRGDGSWQVELTFITSGRMHTAEWIFDPRRRHVLPADDNATRMSLPGSELPQPPSPPPGEATVTRLEPRLGGASGHVPPRPMGPAQGTPGHAAADHAAAESNGIGQDAVGYVAAGQAGHGNAGHGNAGHGNGGSGNGGRARHERPAAGRHGAAEVKPSAPSAPASMTAESRTDASRPAAAERRAGPPTPRMPAQAPQPEARPQAQERQAQQRQAQPARAAEEPARDDFASAPEPAAYEAAQGGRVDQEGPAEPAGEQPGRSGRKAARGRRSSVPSWDEIMFGSSRQRD
jgi:Protein of unknown function (DUF3071)